uniref:Uncharacterized protein n=1 Tax=Strix occidentalis caurina TaxID=311401 RepID=A0A8D0KW06_STROC
MREAFVPQLLLDRFSCVEGCGSQRWIPFAVLRYLIVGVEVIVSFILPYRIEVKGSGNCAYLESKGVSVSGCYLTRKWVCSLNISLA